MLVTVYTDLTSGYETMAFEAPSIVGGPHLVGATYDPRSTNPPVTWHSGCNHCRKGMLTSPLPIKVKRLVHTLLSRRQAGYIPQYSTPVYLFSAPTNREFAKIRYWKTPKSTCVVATSPDNRVLRATRDVDGVLSYGGDLLPADAKILGRCVRFLLTTRRATSRDASAILTTLARATPSTHWHANLCRQIPWPAILNSTELQNYDRDDNLAAGRTP